MPLWTVQTRRRWPFRCAPISSKRPTAPTAPRCRSRNSTGSAISTRAGACADRCLFASVCEVPRIGRRLVLLGRHQEPVRAQEIIFLADHDLRIAFVEVVLRPNRPRVWVVHVFFVDGP